ncbi:MAG: UDP-galactose-4-epimerase [Candidatus Methanofastidiosum methylothiophilum]|uniref:UDP-galactose-4-epimerase n=1 Tax=Candidatus Methanofastidiosum methylothiophilum TaxID=1705564 RepID=A0A150IK68_9EURY|nr:MAG: UDP-galactose-4-epimerase [Candidatus Methanofastidiosum methylthiophilus]KYC48468.1 MAG: UDP-galactose-4-epimerase [Candidatus Methanofastidiosum methylthiophilus]KYC49910.1 MAG: UDP-galactose-4-epimerase [Candidatus Methanofastidiosum methylthiophilus]
MIKDKKIVVTGGAGFIGSNIVHDIYEGNEVTVIDDLSTGNLENIIGLVEKESIKQVKGSITDLKLLQETFSDADFVLHQAAIPSVPRSIKNPIATNKANIDGTLNVLVAARDCNVEKVVFASSSSVYGDTPTLPKIENMCPSPLSPYAITKLCGENYCRIFYEIYGLRTTSLRYFNVYGPMQNPKSEYAAVVPKFISSTIRGNPIEIYGDGEQTRDFTFVEDVVNANLLSCVSKKSDGKILNIAGGKRISINELALKIMKILGKEVEIIYRERREGDVKDSLADISLAKNLIDYAPSYSFDKGLDKAIEYFKKTNFEL